MCSKQKLLQRIEYLRCQMIKVAREKGLTCRESIEISQKLDQTLNKYQRLKHDCEVNKNS
ncbi:MAG TPA: aspartyl-phosphate phosphatase Spo0E family protein [Bacillota bacterium]|nr:aspartyl-phosphate phosphatase Spo0E family protein [Bacillota bacterium]